MNLLLMAIGFLFGIGFGIFVQRAGICYAHGLGEIFMGKGKRITRIFLLMFIITSIGFLASGYFSADLGLKVVGQIRGEGFYNIVSGLLFGAGIMLCGGCILGTLRQIGEGNLTFLIVFASFIPGMALVVFVLDPFLEQGYNIEKILLPELLGIPAVYVTGTLVALSAILLFAIRKKRKVTQ